MLLVGFQPNEVKRMKCNPAELTQTQRFDELYLRSQSSVMLSIERSVCGCGYGGSSWTTQDDADAIIEALNLRPEMNLLDLGAGSGWPALYMAAKTGCNAMLVDLPPNGLQIAEQRAIKDGISKQIKTKVADAAQLPFSDSSFDAVSHSDLLCCLEQKHLVLASCRSVIRSTGRMVFTVISIAPDLSADQRKRAIENGPEFIASDDTYTNMLDQSGWKIINHKDLTKAYSTSCERQLLADELHQEELVSLIGKNEYLERVSGWRNQLEAIQDGLFLREQYSAVPH